MTCRQQVIQWSVETPGPAIAPGSLNPPFDICRAGSAHVLRVEGVYRLYYWATGEDGRNRICMAESDPATPNRWRGLGPVLEPQDGTTYNLCVLEVNGELRMYCTSLGLYSNRPAGVRTGHGAVIPRIGIGYAVGQADPKRDIR